MPGAACRIFLASSYGPRVHERDHDLRAARVQRDHLVARGGRRIARVEAPGLPAVGVLGQRPDQAEEADLDAGDVDDAVGVEEQLPAVVVKVGRERRDLVLGQEAAQQRRADVQVALAGRERGQAGARQRRQDQLCAAGDLGRVGRQQRRVGARAGAGQRQQQVAGVERKNPIRLGAGLV